MAGLRKIVINQQEYLWKYVFDDYDYQNNSYIVVKSLDKKGKLIINFRTDSWEFGYCPFNKGVQAKLNGEPTVINLNQPKYIAEIVKYAQEDLKIEKVVGTIVLDNGFEILHNLGYEFEYKKTLTL